MSGAIQFGRYRLERRLAIGGMAEVILGHIEGPEEFRKRVVIKRILPNLKESEQHIKMFIDEARLAASFNHPNLVQVYELAKIEGQLCIVMEYIEGRDCARILDEYAEKNEYIPIRHALHVVSQAAEGLHHAHEMHDDNGRHLRVVHRDISPANIIVTKQGGVKVVDFGIAKHEATTTETTAGFLKGKFSYMSPEQARGKPIDRRSDVFSMGIVLYELLTVTPCFSAPSQIQLLNAVVEVDFEPIRRVRPDLPREVAYILDQMLVRDVNKRYPTASEANLEIKALLQKLGGAPTTPEIASLMSVPASKAERSERSLSGSARAVTAFHARDELPVSDRFRSPSVVADENSYEALLHNTDRERQRESLWGEAEHITSEMDRLGLRVAPQGKQRRSTVQWMADRLREPRFWPMTLLYFGLALALIAGGLVALYRHNVGEPWNPTEIIEDLVERPKPPPKPSEEVETSILQVISNPPGATVILDGKKLKEVTPVTAAGLATDTKHRVVVNMQGYEEVVREVKLEAGALQSVIIPLPRARRDAPGRVRVKTNPPGALVTLDSRSTGKRTPAELTVSTQSEHSFSATLSGYQSRTVTVRLRPGESRLVTIPLTREAKRGPGYITIDSDPPTQVVIGGNRVGTTPLRKHEVAAGAVIVHLENDRHKLSKTFRLSVSPGETVERSVTFKKGKVAIDVMPWADVYLGKEKLGTTPMPPISLYEGTYALRLVNTSMGVERVIQVTVRAGKMKKVIEKLK